MWGLEKLEGRFKYNEDFAIVLNWSDLVILKAQIRYQDQSLHRAYSFMELLS